MPTVADWTALARRLEATWPPAAIERSEALGGWRLRRDPAVGSGRRVNSAAPTPPDPTDQHAALARLTETPVQLWRGADPALERILRDDGRAPIDATLYLRAPALRERDNGLEPNPRAATLVETVLVSPGVAALERLWDALGITPARRAIMARADRSPDIAWTERIAVRNRARLTGAAFIAGTRDGAVMLHALAVAPEARRQGAARAVLRAARRLAASRKSDVVDLCVEETNGAARALFEGEGFSEIGRYAYWTRSL